MNKEPGMIQMIQTEFSLHLVFEIYPLAIWLVLLSELPEERLP
jgi:hypothetical protein